MEDPTMTFAKAHALISSLKDGDHVLVTTSTYTSEMVVRGYPRRADGAFGSPESLRVTVSTLSGNYAFEVTVDSLYRRKRGRGYIGGGTRLEKLDNSDKEEQT